MNSLKRMAGILWMLAAAGAIYFIISRATHELGLPNVTVDKKIFWYSMLPVFVPIIGGGLALFGYYSLKGEYDDQIGG